jgi:hypothetical protein
MTNRQQSKLLAWQGQLIGNEKTGEQDAPPSRHRQEVIAIGSRV